MRIYCLPPVGWEEGLVTLNRDLMASRRLRSWHGANCHILSHFESHRRRNRHVSSQTDCIDVTILHMSFDRFKAPMDLQDKSNYDFGDYGWSDVARINFAGFADDRD